MAAILIILSNLGTKHRPVGALWMLCIKKLSEIVLKTRVKMIRGGFKIEVILVSVSSKDTSVDVVRSSTHHRTDNSALSPTK